MEKLGDDELSSILSRISDSRDRKSCSEVCRALARAEGLSRVLLRALDPWSLPYLLPRFPNLASFEATRSISDSHLETLARACPALETLNLSLRRSRFTIPEEELDQGDDDDDDFGDHGLRAVAIGCPLLRKVYLRRRRGISDVGVAVVVRYATNLSVLDLSRCSRIADEAIEAIASMSSLMALILHGCSLVTDLGLSHLANGAASQTLRRLDLSECDRISDNGVCLLPKMENLQELDLSECGPKVTDFGGFAIASIYNLKWLNLSWLINLSNATIISLALNCVNLAEIDLTGCELITGSGVQAFAGHGSMEVLVLASCFNVSADDIAHVVFGCPALRYLGLDKSLRGWMSSSARGASRQIVHDRLALRWVIRWIVEDVDAVFLLKLFSLFVLVTSAN